VSGSGMPPDVRCVQLYKKTKVSGVRDPPTRGWGE
jgi:hypothetical protein